MFVQLYCSNCRTLCLPSWDPLVHHVYGALLCDGCEYELRAMPPHIARQAWRLSNRLQRVERRFWKNQIGVVSYRKFLSRAERAYDRLMEVEWSAPVAPLPDWE